MMSTKKTGATCTYIGVDITDRYTDSAHPMDVCGLEISDDKLILTFWTWCWAPSGLTDVTKLLPEISAAKSVMLDGPQGLARVGNRMRACEKALAAAGKTADVRPPMSQPYGGFIASSLDLFAAFHAAEVFVASGVSTPLYEVYPAAIWTRLARRLPNKRCSAGRQARGAILKVLGVALPETAITHDQLDACAAALLGAAADGHIPGIGSDAVGDRVFWDEATGCLREGQIVVPLVDSGLRAKLETAVGSWQLAPAAQSRKIARPRALPSTKLSSNECIVDRPVLTATARQERAGELFNYLVRELVGGRPTLCTYKAAVALVLGHSKYTPAYGSQLIKLAARTGVSEIDGLGEIRLDTFLVNQTHRPGDKHWDSAMYSTLEWERAFAGAVVVE